MTEKKPSEAGAAELSEEDLEKAQGGYANLEVSYLKGKKMPKTAGGDLSSGRVNSFQDGEDLI